MELKQPKKKKKNLNFGAKNKYKYIVFSNEATGFIRNEKKSTISAQKITLDAPRRIICKTGLRTKRRLGKSAPFIADVYSFLFLFLFFSIETP
jgi:hypothetical protein